jgi:hypothetical protein
MFVLLSFSLAGFLPKAVTPKERIRVVAKPGTWRQLFQFLDVASSKDDIVGLECSNQTSHNVSHVAAPLLGPILF